jgi:thiamine-phosphate pyrophosphorylase
MVQLRGKNVPDEAFHRQGAILRELTAAAGSLLFVNDRVDIALAIKADGVHLGQQDTPIDVARRLLLSQILGITCRNPEQAENAQRLGADYIGVGAIFPSPTKPSAPVIGLETLRQVREKVMIPICAIGGIGIDNITEVFRAGADFVAVVSAISQAEEPTKAAKSLVQLSEKFFLGTAGQ